MYQSLTIVGRLGGDPEMRYTPAGAPVTSFSVATDRTYKDNAGKTTKEVTWFRVTAWGKLGENANAYLHKGSRALIEGRLNPDPATGGPKIFNRRDGTAGANFELTAETIRFLDTKEESQAATNSSPSWGEEEDDQIAFDDQEGLPF